MDGEVTLLVGKEVIRRLFNDFTYAMVWVALAAVIDSLGFLNTAIWQCGDIALFVGRQSYIGLVTNRFTYGVWCAANLEFSVHYIVTAVFRYLNGRIVALLVGKRLKHIADKFIADIDFAS